ncbi:hypothetical protein LA080_013307 [Diaporthe eres]|nr:hypothetical protein LA080_013307 [Diaporthe eres]
MDTFQHPPLDRSKECIRLLRFLDQTSSSELDHFSLETYDIATTPSFVALSYTWGRPEPNHDIVVNGSLLSIRENLRVALKALRSFFPDKAPFLDTLRRWNYRGKMSFEGMQQIDGYPFMWIGPICINQSDHLEENHQVNMMGRIFSTAERVISWLGDEADNSSRVIKTIRGTKHTRQCGFKVKQAMEAFARRPYWRRMWVIQEFMLPQDLVILCGPEGVWWEDLFHFWHDDKFVCGTEWGDLYHYTSGESVLIVDEGGMAALIFARCSRRGDYFRDLD